MVWMGRMMQRITTTTTQHRHTPSHFKLSIHPKWLVWVKLDVGMYCSTSKPTPQPVSPKRHHHNNSYDNISMMYHPWYDRIYPGSIPFNINRLSQSYQKHRTVREMSTIHVNKLVQWYGPLYWRRHRQYHPPRVPRRPVVVYVIVVVVASPMVMYYYVSIVIPKIYPI